MQIKKTKKLAIKPSSNTLFDNDFASGFEDSKFDKFKPALKVLVVAILLVGAAWGVSAYFGSTDTKNDTNKNEASNATQQYEESDSPEAAQDIPAATESTLNDNTGPVSSGSNTQPQSNSDSTSPTSATKAYDPSKCDSLNNEATRLRQTADQKKTTFDNVFAARKDYGYFYDKYGNSIDAQQAYNNQEAQLDLLQTDWQDALNKGNAAYAKYQECRASL